MENPSLRDLPGFPSSYVGFVEGAPAPGAIFPNHPEKALLLSRCRTALRQTLPGPVVSEIIREETPVSARSHSWSESVLKLESHSAVVVGASADVADFGTSLVPLLKCLTAIKLAIEISHEGIPAVPLLWVGDPGQAETDNEQNNVRIRSPRIAGQPADGLQNSLRYYFSNLTEISSSKDLYRDSIRDLLTWLVREFGLVPVDPAAIGSRLAHTPDLEDLQRTAAGLCEREFDNRAVVDGDGHDSSAPRLEKAGLSGALLLRLSLPVAAEVIGPEDFVTGSLLANLVGAAGMAKPFLWPRVSATIVDHRSCRIMKKFRLGLPDVLQGSAVLLRRLEADRSASEISSRLETLAGHIQARITEVFTRASGDPRAARRVQASGSKMLHQLRKLAVRLRLSADAQQGIAARQFEGLCSRIVPGGELQERRMSATQLLSAHSESVLPVLYRKIDVWDLGHQLIGLD